MSENQVDIQILGHNYSINCPKSEVGALQMAANQINSVMHDLRKQSPSLGHEKLLVLTCLNVCSELLEAQKNNQDVKQSKRLLEKMLMETKQYLHHQ